MLRKRSRAVTSNKALMADNGYIPSPKGKYTKPTASPFTSPRLLFSGFSANGLSESDSVKSPTSTLDNKTFSNLGKPFWADINTTTTTTTSTKSWEKKPDSGVGLGIIDALLDENPNQKFSNPSSRMVLFGSQLKIQIPNFPPHLSSVESPKSPTDFGIKTRIRLLGSQSGSANSGFETPKSPMIFTGCLSASEMESSEDYTCVITHGPNPKTTHIFDNCIVKNCCGIVGFSSPKKDNSFCLSDKSDYPSKNFLSFCHTCKKNLEQGKDIYMYRGEKAFCCHECRNQEILYDEGMEKSCLDSSLRTCS